MILLLLSCAPKPQPTTPEPAAETYRAPASDKVIQAHMDQNFAQGTAARDALVAGKLDGARSDLAALATRTDPGLMGRQSEPYLQILKTTVSAASTAQTATELGTGVGKMVSACAACHSSFEVPLSPVTAQPPEGWAGHGKAGTWMVGALWTGVLASADTAWTAGAAPLSSIPTDLASYGVRGATTTEASAAIQTLTSVAATASQLKTREERAAAVGKIVGACGQCHVEQGAKL